MPDPQQRGYRACGNASIAPGRLAITVDRSPLPVHEMLSVRYNHFSDNRQLVRHNMMLGKKKSSPESKDYREFSELSQRLFQPIFHTIYAHKFDDARKLLGKTQLAIAKLKMHEDCREALGYDLIMASYQFAWHPDVDGWTKDCYHSAMEKFSKPARSPLGDIIRRKWIMYIKLHADIDGYDSLNRNEILELVESIPYELATKLWFDIASWAFDHSDVELLEQAFERYLTHPSSHMGQALWQRINLMYQLLQNKATTRDVGETIRTLEIKPQVREFLDRLLPAIEQADLLTPELRQLLDERIAEVRKHGGMPRPERKTKSFIKGDR